MKSIFGVDGQIARNQEFSTVFNYFLLFFYISPPRNKKRKKNYPITDRDQEKIPVKSEVSYFIYIREQIYRGLMNKFIFNNVLQISSILAIVISIRRD